MRVTATYLSGTVEYSSRQTPECTLLDLATKVYKAVFFDMQKYIYSESLFNTL